MILVIVEYGIRGITSIVMMSVLLVSFLVTISLVTILGLYVVKIYRVEKRNRFDNQHGRLIINNHKRESKKNIGFLGPNSNNNSHTTKTKDVIHNPITNDCGDLEEDEDDRDLFSRQNLPQEMILHICSYLHPQSVTTLACINRASRDLIDGNSNISQAIWRSLWSRDYGTVLLRWEVSRAAFEKSLSSFIIQQPRCQQTMSACSLEQTIYNAMEPNQDNDNDNDNDTSTTNFIQAKDFYFHFQYGYVDYVLAGHNTPEQCLFGLHGHIFDFTEFAPHHPGLMDPILLEGGGKDATNIFEDIRHSKSARIIASQLCIILDRSTTCRNNYNNSKNYNSNNNDNCGLAFLPTPDLTKRKVMLEQSNTRPPKGHNNNGNYHNLLPTKFFSKPRRPPTLNSIRNKFHYGQQLAQLWAGKEQRGKLGRLPRSGMRVYYDPFVQRWKGWYTGSNWEHTFFDININKNSNKNNNKKITSQLSPKILNRRPKQNGTKGAWIMY